mmetsp:Transcript_24037/g.37072  ORF Transcript_24037/g.37072 Transcript_24037/m.37072 type:complete len:88 (-) Transcript_24037:773-1036(-)
MQHRALSNRLKGCSKEATDTITNMNPGAISSLQSFVMRYFAKRKRSHARKNSGVMMQRTPAKRRAPKEIVPAVKHAKRRLKLVPQIA